MKYLSSIFLLTLCIFSIKTNFIEINQTLIDSIYNQNKFYLIYKYQQPTLKTWSAFMDFCRIQKRTCAALNQSVTGYDQLIQFIGYKAKQYFLLINGYANKKYILQTKSISSIIDLQRFQTKALRGQWQSFYASQKPKDDKYMPCRSIAGIQVKKFLQEPGMKVIYLYSDMKKCQVCGQMLRFYADTAQNFYKRNVISFAYINVSLNDHPLIKTKKTPSFMLFESQSQIPKIFEGDEYLKMELRIKKLIQKETGEIKSLTRHEYTKFLSDLQDI